MFIFYLLLIFQYSSFAQTCDDLSFSKKNVGKINTTSINGTTDFLFLSPSEILVANFAKSPHAKAPLQIYKKTKGIWAFDPDASKDLPGTFHARQLLMDDFESDGIKEVIISDHGPDLAPYKGAHPLVLRFKNNKWSVDEEIFKLEKAFTFNQALIPYSKDKLGLYRANVSQGGNQFYILEKSKWISANQYFSKTFSNEVPCMMTALAEDFNNDGIRELFLGGCDRDKKLSIQKNDRILYLKNDLWELTPEQTLPDRIEDESWGTVFVKSFDYNHDGLKDLLTATHDFGFHKWKIQILKNVSTKDRFQFQQIPIDLKQEKMTEGFVYAIEDFTIKNSQGILVEVRDVIRSKKNHPASMSLRLLLLSKDGYRDATKCLPGLPSNLYHAKKIPGKTGKILLVPFTGDIVELSISIK